MANCWRPSRSLFWGRPRASINRASHHRVREKGEDIERSGRTLAEREREATELALAVHRTSSRTPLARLFFLCIVHRQPPEAIHHTTHWSRVLHHNGGLNQYKPCVPCVVRCFQLRSREEIGRRSVGERSPCAPQCSNLKGLPEPEIRHLVCQVGGRQSPPS